MIYIQSDSERKRPHHFDAACAMFGAIENGQDYRLTSFEEVKSGKFNALIKNNLFVGSVEFMKEVFSKFKKEEIRVPKNSNRKHIKMKLGQAKELAKSGKSIFIKPFDIKLFTGFILDEYQYSSISNLSDDIDIMVYDVFKSPIKSEFRCYINRNKVVDIKNYSGDLFCAPSENYLNSIIEENKSTFPISYTIDIDILDNDDNVVVEFNDMWAIGNYGISNDIYLKLLKERYFEIFK